MSVNYPFVSNLAYCRYKIRRKIHYSEVMLEDIRKKQKSLQKMNCILHFYQVSLSPGKNG